jgi:alpha-glucosidase
MDHGVRGFRLDAIKHGFEAQNFVGKNEPPRPNYNPSDRTVAGTDSSYDSLLHIHTTNQPETFDLLREWRFFLDRYSEKDGVPRYWKLCIPLSQHSEQL